MRKSAGSKIRGTIAIVVSIPVFIVPFVFIVLTASKGKLDSADLGFTLPKQFQLWSNLLKVLSDNNWQLLGAFWNSAVLTVLSVGAMTVLAAMVAYVLERRPGRLNGLIEFIVLSGLIVPPAVVPTIRVLQTVGLFNTLGGLVLIEIAFGMSFCVLLFRAFIGSVPRDLDEAAVLDGAGPLRLFFGVIFPLLRPVIVTVVVVQSVAVFNDFANPLYFLPNVDTVQLTLFNFQSQYDTSWNLLFADILLISIPPLVLYLFFNRQIVGGMSAGAVKG